MSTPDVVRAEPSDADSLAELIYSSGSDNLNSVFTGHKDNLSSAQRKHICVDFLGQALNTADGQFGYQNQYVIRHGVDIAACVSFWVKPMPEAFSKATLASLLAHFSGLDCALILHNSQQLAHLVRTPQEDSLCIGHLAVQAKYRRQGHSKILLKFCEKQARLLAKARLFLDVKSTNTAALKSYQSFGFKPVNTTNPTIEGQKIGLCAHIHMCKTL